MTEMVSYCYVIHTVDAAPHDVVLVPNVTTGVNTVVQSVCQRYSSQDTVLIFNTTYGRTAALLDPLTAEYCPSRSSEEVGPSGVQ